MLIHKKDSDPLMDLYNSSSLEQLNENFEKICENYFIETFALAILSKRDLLQSHLSNESSCFQNYPSEWAQRYQINKYYLDDPVYSFAKNITTPHCWHIDKFTDITNNQKKLLSEGNDFGIKKGTTIPLLPTDKFQGFLTLIDTNIHHPDVLYILSNASNIYANRKERIELRNKFNSLTDKEMKVLSLKAEGYLSKQISHELSLSDATVLFHLKNIRRKLGFTTTEQAIFKYIFANN